MKLIYRYIYGTLMGSILLGVLLILGIDTLFAFVREIRYIGIGEYDTWVALQYIILTLPKRVYDMFPMACLLGSIMGLGLLASHHELVAMRVAGVSLSQITWAVLRLGFLLALMVTLMGEYVLPHVNYTAEFMRESARGKGQAMMTAEGAWLRDSTSFIHIERILPGGRMEGIMRYEFSNDELTRATFSEEAVFTQNEWVLLQTRLSNLQLDRVTTETIAEQVWDTDISPDLLTILVTRPDALSVTDLYGYLHYLQDNGLDDTQYSLVFWNKIFQPLETLVMIFLAIPFIFGPLRSTTMGLRIVAGVMTGFAFYVLNEMFGPLSMVYHFPPMLAALLPTIVFGLLAVWLLRRAY